jgi:pimeloyl-ACP methyl ester carboxylesterase
LKSFLKSEITGSYVDVLGYRTYFEGVGSGPPVVCIHTGGADGREYRQLLPHLAKVGWSAIALDMPGHGKSYPDLETLRPIDNPGLWIDFVLAFSRTAGLERPIYVGAAMSASLLLRLASEHPDATAGIVAAGATADYTGSLSEEFLDVLNHPQVNLPDFMESTTLGLSGPTAPLINQNECIWQNARNLTPEVMDADLRIYASHDIKNALKNIVAPVLHLRGEFDRTVSDLNAKMIRDGIPHVTMVDMPGVGHYSMMENPALFNGAVEDFLNGVRQLTGG